MIRTLIRSYQIDHGSYRSNMDKHILFSLALIKINRLSFDQSGAYLAIASNDIKILQGISQIHSVLILLLRLFKNQNGRNFIIKASCNEKLKVLKRCYLNLHIEAQAQ